MISEITVEDLAARLKTPDEFILLDVREPVEVAAVRIADQRVLLQPMSEVAQKGVAALPEAVCQKDAEIFVICHHGSRSAQLTGWLSKQGWTRIYSVAGGIDAYARRIDPTVGLY